MKLISQALLFVFLWVLVCGCPSPTIANDELKELRANHYDFKDLVRKSYRGLYFDVPKSFITTYSDYLYKKDGLSLSSPQLGVYLSVEQFTKSEADEFVFSYEWDVPKYIAVQDFYMEQRRNSLLYLENSIRTDLPKGSKLKGAMEVVFGRADEYSDDLKYMIATVEKDNNYYVFQFITSQELSAYLFDDFKAIVKSAR